ncbi:hypothetical protein [Desulfonatronovibrio hydrogenovorans]|uniref:hypothetical protein n=1 Tax=Desulfonatronovibrio hydrogenovorans TaxID=53245 RepID=UPI00048BDB9D|nr:hypothetical protein [Desulfonatronovibrio hydrogenovorans]
MLVQNFFQVTPKSGDEIKSELWQSNREIKIDPDAQGGRDSKSHGRDFKGRKEKKASDSLNRESEAVHQSQTGPYEVYNRKGRVVRLKISA